MERLEELAEKAMPGPWAYGTDAEKCGAKYPDSNRVYANLHPQDDPVYGILLSVNHNLKLCDTTAAYIAAANPQAILELIADYERLEKEANWLANKLVTASEILANATGMETGDLNEAGWRKVAREAVEKEDNGKS